MTGSDGRNIVVIEDEDAIRDVVAYNLARAGFEVATADNGREGLELVRDQSPGLVVLDLMLPELDGIEVCRSMRADPAMRDIPVIMLTAKAGDDDVWAGWQAGASYYLTKPFDLEELVRYLHHLEAAELVAELSGSVTGPGPGAGS